MEVFKSVCVAFSVFTGRVKKDIFGIFWVKMWMHVSKWLTQEIFCQEATTVDNTVDNSGQQWTRGTPLTLCWCMWLVSSVALPTSFLQSKFSNSPNWLSCPGEDVFEGHLLPEEPLLLDVEVAGGKVLEVSEGARRQGWVNACRDREGGAWKQSNCQIENKRSKSLEFSLATMP